MATMPQESDKSRLKLISKAEAMTAVDRVKERQSVDYRPPILTLPEKQRPVPTPVQ